MNQIVEHKADEASAKLRFRGEMRLATAMMVDMVDSTVMSERLGPEGSFQLLDEILGIARSVVAVHGGTMMDEIGDGFFALFGAPVSIERASLAAIRAAIEVCERMRIEAGRFEKQFGFTPKLRVGLAAGEVLLTGSVAEGTIRATGKTVNLSARLQTLADHNGVVCAKSVSIETQGWVRLEPLGPQSLKGFKSEIEVFHVREVLETGQTQAADDGRQKSAFTGRSAEITRLTRWIDEANTEHPVSLIIGEAGIGKSRLTSEFAARLGERRMIMGSCHPTATARPLAPIIEVLRNFAGWRPDQTAEELATALAPILPEPRVERDLLTDLLAGQSSSDEEADTAGPTDAIALTRALIFAITSLGRLPDVLVAIEDLHWIDPLSAEVLENAIHDAPNEFRLLGVTRPTEWLDTLPTERLELIHAAPLETSDIRNIARAVIGEAVDEALVDKLAEDSEGNPFFAIEILHNIAALGDEVDAARIGTIQNIALSRFDRLEPDTKELLRLASVQGRSFRFDVLVRASGMREYKVAELLGAAEGVVEPDPADPNQSSRFHHILQRDSIYATIPSQSRGEKHLAVAEALEACAGDDAYLHADQLASHYENGGEPLKAIKYLRIAANNAYNLYALASCNALMERAFRFIEENDDQVSPEELERALSLRLRCLDVMDQFRTVIEISEAWLPRLREREGSGTLSLLLALVGKAYCHMLNYDRSYECVTEALEMAERHGHERAAIYAKVSLMRVLIDSRRGDITDVERLFEETRAFTEKLSDGSLYANRMFHMMGAYRTEGMMRRSFEVNEEMEAFGAERMQRHIQVVALWNRSVNAVTSNDYETGLVHAKEGLERSVRSSADREIFTLLRLASELSLGMDPPLEGFQEIYENSTERGEFTTRNATAGQIGYLLCSKGQLWRGWKQLQYADKLIEAASKVELRFLWLHRIEFLLIILGFFKAGGKSPKLGFRDMLIGIYLRLTARRKIKAYVRNLLDDFDAETGSLYARTLTAVGALAALEGDKDKARENFDRAGDLFTEEGLQGELARLSTMRSRAGL